jgi:MoaA/NifB/PqqE/SkfB family radical SAM enzyme
VTSPGTEKQNHIATGGIGPLFKTAFWIWGRSSPRRMLFMLKAALRVWKARRRHQRCSAILNGPIPAVVAISPTMRCNLRCVDCYSRGRPGENELSDEELAALFEEAENLGVMAIVVTGGEPLMRPGLLALASRYRRLLFVFITNGSLLTKDLARLVAASGNIVMLVSIEGSSADTDARRGPGAHAGALQALRLLRDAGALFGFAATNMAENTAFLGSDQFIDQMIELKCTLGFFTEYIPCGPNSQPGWLLDDELRNWFRRRVLELRRRKPIVLIQFPQDEYGLENLCTAAGRASLHINSQGGVEPCPFVAVACDNVREGGLAAACRSSFLNAIREQPALLKRRRYACSLFEHLSEIEALAGSIIQEQRVKQ